MAKTAPLPGLAAPEELSGDRQFSICLSRGLQLLRAFGRGDAVLGNRELCARTGLPKVGPHGPARTTGRRRSGSEA